MANTRTTNPKTQEHPAARKSRRLTNAILIATAVTTLTLVILKITGLLAISWLVAISPLPILFLAIIVFLSWGMLTLSQQINNC